MLLFLLILHILVNTLGGAKSDPCLEEKVVGRCRARLPRFYFDR